MLNALVVAYVNHGFSEDNADHMGKRLVNLILDQMIDYSLNFHYFACQLLSKMFCTSDKQLDSLLTYDQMKVVFQFDYDLEEVGANERTILRSLINKHFTILERMMLNDTDNPDTFNFLIVYSLQTFYYSNLLSLEFLSTSITTTLKRFADRRPSLNSLQHSLQNLGLKNLLCQSLKHTSAYKLFIALFKGSFEHTTERIELFTDELLEHFMNSYVEWDNPFEYYILLDQRWLRVKGAMFREDFVVDLIQKVRLDSGHKIRRCGNLLRLFCKFFDKYAPAEEGDLKLTRLWADELLPQFNEESQDLEVVQPPVQNTETLKKYVFASAVLSLNPDLYLVFKKSERIILLRKLKDLNYERMISGELEAESDSLTQAFGNRVTYLHTLLMGRHYNPQARVKHMDGKSNNHYSGFTLSKTHKFGLLSLFRRFSTFETTKLWNIKTRKPILSGSGLPNSNLNEMVRIKNRLYIHSREVEQDGSILIYDVVNRTRYTFVLDNILLSGSKLVKIFQHYLLVGNDDENSIEVYTFNPEELREEKLRDPNQELDESMEMHQQVQPIQHANFRNKQKKVSSISLWRYGRLSTAQLLNYGDRSLLMLCFSNSRHAHFLHLANGTITKLRLADGPLHTDNSKTHVLFDEKYCRLLTLSNDAELHLTDLRHLFA